ncbi:DUF3530 family protein [Agarivorans sp. QJM3NY_29]|uniref:DUF3530 family protein n=1 Tax=unclassified Agarivorans TaxID=2636026 RepID=UPI003D7E94E8
MRIYKLFWLITVLSTMAWAQPQSLDFSQWPVKGELKSLTVEQRQFVSLWIEQQTPQQRGTAILLPDWGNSPSSEDMIDSLRQTLPSLGWQTGAILPPAPQASLMQDSEPQDQQNTYQQQLSEVIEAARQTQAQPFGFQLLIAQGVMGAWLVELLAEQQLSPPDGLILMSTYYPNQALNQRLAKQLARLSIPVLDIYDPNYNQWQFEAAQQRLIASNKSQKLNYRQTQLPVSAETAPNHALLTKSIYGWLNALGWY